MGATLSAFGPLAACFHDAAQPRARADEISFLLTHAQGDATLDVMCGSGRVLVPCLVQGAKMHGVDQSPSMIARCEGNLRAAGLEAPLYRQDVAHLNVPFRYGCAIIAGGALQLFTDPAAMHAALERIRAHLVPPGKLVVECRIPASAQQRLAAPLVEIAQVKLADGSQIVRRSETTWTPEAKLCRARHRYTHRRGTERLGEEHETIASTWYERDEIGELVGAAGFREVRIETRVRVSEEGDAFYLIATI